MKAILDPNRDRHGHFVAGNNAAKGRREGHPGVAFEEAQRALNDALDYEGFVLGLRKHMECWLDGDWRAGEALLDRVLGRPVQSLIQMGGGNDKLEEMLGKIQDLMREEAGIEEE